MDYKTSYRLLLAGLWGGLALVVLGGALQYKSQALAGALGILGAAAMLLGVGQALLFYKCPHCGRGLDIRGDRPRYCPHCGHPLDRA